MLQPSSFAGFRSGRSGPVIVVRRKKTVHLPHRKETWKVAYADFVTALMALFSVLWVLSNKPHSQESIARYFHESEQRAAQVSLVATVTKTANPVTLDQLASQLRSAIQLDPRLKDIRTEVEFKLAVDGLRINLLENSRIPFFGTGRGDPTDTGKALLERIAQQLGTVPNRVVLEGHTDSKPYAGAEGYSNWELSLDRANAARRVMMKNGLRADQMSEIIGLADTQPGTSGDSRDLANRRVTIIVKDVRTS